MAIARQNKRETNIVEGVDLDEIDLAVSAAQQQPRGTTDPEHKPSGPKKSQDQVSAKTRRIVIVMAIVLASLIMALSILMPSLSAIVEGLSSGAATTEVATTAEEESSDEDSEADDAMSGYIETVDERYSSLADNLKAKVEADASDKASLINLANTYYEWGTSLNYYATSDEQIAHKEEILQNAITYYEQYLALQDASAAYVDKAMCQYYLGNTETAIAELEDFCSKTSDYAPAWYDLGMMYNGQGDTESALAAYNTVLTVDPNDKHGLKSSAESQISSLSESDEADTSDAASDETGQAESE